MSSSARLRSPVKLSRFCTTITRRGLGEQQRLLQGRIAAADDGDRLSRIERAVTDRAERNAVADEALLTGNMQQPVLGARSENDGFRRKNGVAAVNAKAVSRALDTRDLADFDIRAGIQGLLDHFIRQLAAAD